MAMSIATRSVCAASSSPSTSADRGKACPVPDVGRPQSISKSWGSGGRECWRCNPGAGGKGGSGTGFELKCHMGLPSQQVEAPLCKVSVSLKQVELSRDQLVLPSPQVHQLEISLHQLRLRPGQLDLVTEPGVERHDDNLKCPPSSSDGGSSDDTPGVCTSVPVPDSPRQHKKVWSGVRKQKRMPPQPPWSENDFRHRERLLLEAVLSEAHEGRVPIDDVLDSWLGKITRVELTNLIRDLGNLKQMDLVLEVLHWMQMQKGRLKPNRHVYSAVLGVLGRAGMVSKAREVFDAEQLKGLGESVYLYNAMMGAYVRSGFFKRAWKLYEELCEKGLEADEVTFNTLFTGISRADMPTQMAEKLYTKMKQTGISAGRYTYNTLIMLFSKVSNLEGAAKILQDMTSANQLPDLCTFNTLVGMYARAGKYDEAVKIFNTLRAAGFKADTVTYTNVIQMFSQAQKLDDAVECFVQMQRAGCKPDLMTYSLMVHVYGRAGMAHEAGQTFRRMQEAGFKPNVVTWSSLIQAYGKKGMLAELNSSFTDMQKSGLKADATLYNIMMNAYRQALPSQAACLFRRMQSEGIQPNEACYNTMIHAYAQDGNLEDARAVFKQMSRAGFRPDKLSRRFLNNLRTTRGRQRDSSESFPHRVPSNRVQHIHYVT